MVDVFLDSLGFPPPVAHGSTCILHGWIRLQIRTAHLLSAGAVQPVHVDTGDEWTFIGLDCFAFDDTGQD